MANSKVTITLGRYGQKVVKESWGDSAGGRDNGTWSSGSKRTLSESFGSSADFAYGENKRLRGEINSRSYGSSSRVDVGDSGLCANDLRLKLRRKRSSRLVELEKGYRRNELREKDSGFFQSRDVPGDIRLSREPSSIRMSGPPRERSLASSYSSWPSSGVRTRSPETTPQYSAGLPSLRSVSDELRRLPPRPVDGARTGHVRATQPVDPYRPKAPMPPVPRHYVEPEKLIREHPSAPIGMHKPPPAGKQSVTVSGFLHSLGLEKYSINFQAEEIDIPALKQMGDRDLKELGIPMGPRKKILLTLQAQTRRPVHPLPSNLIQ